MKNFTIEIKSDECLAGNIIEVIRRFDPTLEFSAELLDGYGIVITVSTTEQTKGSLKKVKNQFIELYRNETWLTLIETNEKIYLEDGVVKITSIKSKERSRPNQRTSKHAATLFLTDDLKRRIQAQAKAHGVTDHTLMLRAIESQITALEAEQEFLEGGNDRDASSTCGDETAYLMNSPVNAQRLVESVLQLKTSNPRQ